MITKMTLQERKEAHKANLSQYKARIMICAGTGCVANGSLKVYDEFLKKIEDSGLSVSVAVELKEEKNHLSSRNSLHKSKAGRRR